MRRQTLAALALVPALALALPACGAEAKTAGGKSTAKAASDQQKMRQFAQCMREHGVDMEDPDTDGKITIKSSAKPGQAGKGPQGPPKEVQDAQKACRHLMPNGGKPPKMSAQDLAKARAHSKCMRDHGITDFPDPSPDGGIQIKAGNGSDLDPQNQRFKDADKACQKYAPDGGKGTKRSGGGGS
ncbi:hypothetical protein [Actinomadura fibrosa]|uniref:Uncharacterized protein n=1 Tax=Actinomadura fibrosa TaxID=111802 RepID=A0ABW2XV34_9ACTN|nr:hypothetical protein [Actinomadura fibrosa]